MFVKLGCILLTRELSFRRKKRIGTPPPTTQKNVPESEEKLKTGAGQLFSLHQNLLSKGRPLSSSGFLKAVDKYRR